MSSLETNRFDNTGAREGISNLLQVGRGWTDVIPTEHTEAESQLGANDNLYDEAAQLPTALTFDPDNRFESKARPNREFDDDERKN